MSRRRYSGKRMRKKQADFKGYFLIVSAVTIIASFVYFFYESQNNVVARLEDSMCRVDEVISRETAFIIDATDYFTTSQALLIKKEIEKVLETSMVDERFTVYVLDEKVNEKDVKEPILSVCNPGDGSDKSEITHNKRRLREQWQNNFYDKVYKSIDGLIGEHTANQSPILEMIKYVSVKTMYQSTADVRRIILVSDMLHHTARYSHYPRIPKFEDFSELPYALEVRPQLENVQIDILYLVRPQDIGRQNRGHIQFWEQFFKAGGGMIHHVMAVN